MSSFNDVLELKAELSGLIDNPPIDVASVSTILASLDELEITTTILQETFIGRLIKQVFDVVEDPEIRQTAKSLLQKWMRQVDKPAPTVTTTETPTSNKKFETKKKSPTSDAPRNITTGNPTRDKVLNLLYQLFAEQLSLPSKKSSQIAAEIEEAMFLKFDQTPAYRQKYRSLKAALTSNKEVLELFLNNKISPSRLVEMSPSDFFSETQKTYHQAVADTYKQMATLHEEGGSSTDMFKCGKCGHKKTTYTQKQTRSADEPMTTFVRCVVCDNRWKFC
ncbi:hypothetical protein GEMRC1_013745 [Eukaryota sp. GEM-RC1]